ncbi:MAG: ion transporter [Treponemataceae bacterium]
MKLYEKIFTAFISILILLSVILIILESNQNFALQNAIWLEPLNTFIYIMFIIEFIFNVCRKQWKGLVFDFLAILPFIIPFIRIDLRVLRLLRILRITKIFTIPAYKRSIKLFARVFLREKEILIITLSISFTLVLFSSVLMWHLEHETQPDKFPDISTTMWWAVATLTTVGYGDIYPVTPLGRLLASIIAIIGIGLIAVPSGIISAGFIAQYNEEKEKKHKKRLIKNN